MSSIRRIACLTAMLPGLLAASSTVAKDAPQESRHSAFVSGMGAALDGTAAIGPLEIPVDLSISDVFDALEFGAMVAHRADGGRWSFTGDATFVRLGGSGTSEGADRIDPTVGVQYTRPIGGNWRLNLRGELGGVGIGSDLLAHFLGTARWHASERVGVFFGYRLISFDDEDREGRTNQRYDLTGRGPMDAMSFTFDAAQARRSDDPGDGA